MTIDITALQTLPEVNTTATGLLPPVCQGGKTKIFCNTPSCTMTKIVVSEI